MAFALAVSLGERNLSASDWDELRGRVLSQFDFRLHWNNISGPPHWIGGVPIQRKLFQRLSTVTLVPGESVVLRVPAESFVRAYCPNETLSPDDLLFWVSNGSGLQVQHVGFLSPDGKSLVTIPDHPETALVRVCRPESCLTPLTVALFVSYREATGEPVSYRTLACTDAPASAIKRDEDSTNEPFHHVDPSQPVTVRVVGPVRLKLETHLRYPALESEIHQSYQLRLLTNLALLKIVDFETSIDHKRQAFVNQVPATLGRRQTAYVEIPPGPQELTIDASAAMFLRVFERDRPEWWLPGNRPPLSTEQAQSWGYLFEDRVSHWNLTLEDFHAVLSDSNSTDGVPLLAFRSARDNSRPQGPLRAYFLLRALAAFRSDDPDLKNLAGQMRGRHTWFRDLMPVRTGSHARQRTGYFLFKHLQSPHAPDHEIVIDEQHVDELVAQIPSSKFTRVANSLELASAYRLPANLGATILQIIVDQQSIRGYAPLFVQFDRATPIRLLAAGGPELTPTEYTPGATEAGMTAFEVRHGQSNTGTLGGAFAQLRQPAPLLSVGHAELVVPQGVSEIRVWSPAIQPESTSVALRYLDSKNFQLTEMEYVEAARRAGVAQSGPALFTAELQRQGYLSQDQYAEQELRNHWYPLIAWLREQDEIFRRGLAPDNSTVQGTALSESQGSVPEASSVNELLKSARAHASSMQWLPALEDWSEALPNATSSQRKEIVLGRMTALRNLGEDTLHERGLRGLYLFDPDDSIRSEAVARLEQLYRDSNDEDELLRLQVVRTLASLQISHLIALAQQLADSGRMFDSLSLALILPRDDRVTRLVLRTSLGCGWWQHFDRALGGLTDPQEQHYWRAWRDLATGAVTLARGHLEQAGSQGVDLLNRLQTGNMIRSQFQHAEPSVRARAVFDWERWAESSPLPHRWSNEESLVTDYESSAIVANSNRGATTQYYIGRENRPITLIAQGPVRLRIGARPLHPNGSNEPIDDWLIITTGEQRLQVPINNNHASDNLQFADQPEWTPGGLVTKELKLGPGRYEVCVFGESVPLAIRLERLRPERELPVLPPVEPSTVTAALTGSFEGAFYEPIAMGVVNVTSLGQPVESSLPIHSRSFDPVLRTKPLEGLPFELSNRVALRLGLLPPSVAAGTTLTLPTISENCSPRERFSLSLRVGLKTDDVLSDLPSAIQEDILWHKGRGTDAVALPLDRSDITAVQRRMASFLWLYEHDKAKLESWLAHGEYFFSTHASTPGLRGMHSRLTSKSEWSLTSQIESSAGLRTVPTDGWEPEAPYLRVRKSLLRPMETDEQLIAGDQVLAVRLEGKRDTRLECSVQLVEPPHVLMSPLTFTWQLDTGPEEERHLTPEHAQMTFIVDVPKGEHTVRIRCIDPWVNQFLRVRIVDLNDGEGTSLQSDLERMWHVATVDEAVIVPVEGPSLVRIDELRAGRTTNELRLIPEGLHRLELPALNGPESLYRIFQLRYDADRNPHRIKHLNYPDEASIAPYIVRDHSDGLALNEQPGDRIVPVTLAIPDVRMAPFDRSEFTSTPYPRWLAVNQGEDFLMEAKGIWSSDLGYFSRRPLLEGISGGSNPDEFFQLNFNHHRRYDEQDMWTESDFLFRERIRGGETLGVSHSVRRELAGSPWVLYFDGSGYLQHVDHASGSDWEGSIDLRVRLARQFILGPRTHHMPQVTLFGRGLSLDTNPFPSGVIDQDILTSFKRDHLGGLIFADKIVHRPSLDTEWWARPALMTNENFNVFKPDNLSLAFGWSQWIRPVGFDLSYRITGYFDDSDRVNAYAQQLITLEGFTEGWICGAVRCETSLFLQHNLGSSDTSIAAVVSLSWDSGYNDWHYRPGEMDFQTVRKWRGSERRIPQTLQLW
ncbi:MAG TPA: hypothetical protein VMM56_14560 [Planctomycetaceae bacterium]|nr:hypothetical protein [Planctomycetaceae bacterium]